MDILIVEPDRENLDKCKKILDPLSAEHTIHYVSLPEEALDLITTEDIAVLVTELDMEIMSAEELFQMAEVLRPNCVKLLMTKVDSQEIVLPLYNRWEVFEIILKPLKFQEDLLEPVERGLKESKVRRAASGYIEESKKRAEKLAQNYDNLRQENIKRSREYSNIYQAFCGLMEANLSGILEKLALDDEELRTMKLFISKIAREYINTYVFLDEDLEEMLTDLNKEFTNEAHKSTINIINHCKDTMSRKNAKESYFAFYMMSQLCRSILPRYEITGSIEEQDQFYMLKFLNDPKTSELNGSLVYTEEEDYVRQVLHLIVEECLKKLYVKSMKGYEGNPFVAVIMIAKDR